MFRQYQASQPLQSALQMTSTQHDQVVAANAATSTAAPCQTSMMPSQIVSPLQQQQQPPQHQLFSAADFEPNPVYNPTSNQSVSKNNNNTSTMSNNNNASAHLGGNRVGNPASLLGNAHGPRVISASPTGSNTLYLPQANTTTITGSNTTASSSPYHHPPIPSQISFDPSNNNNSNHHHHHRQQHAGPSQQQPPNHALDAAHAMAALSSNNNAVVSSDHSTSSSSSASASSCSTMGAAAAAAAPVAAPSSSAARVAQQQPQQPTVQFSLPPPKKIVVTMDRNKQFMIFVKILLHHLKKTGEMTTHSLAQKILQECVLQHRKGNPAFAVLHEVCESRLLRLVGGRHWNRCVQLLNLHLKLQADLLNQQAQQKFQQQQQQPLYSGSMPPSSSSAHAAAVSVPI